jgi:8-oxo-dGTP pyrophosphatase MutT (NUDIX family)
MGRRGAGHVFMPDKWVFPGGRVEPGDARAAAATELAPQIAERLAYGARRAPRALALAAIRETFEETGFVVGRRGAPPGKPAPGWAEYSACDAAPELHRLAFIGRAVTPPGRSRRFDARFFLAHADEAMLADPVACKSDELGGAHWVAIDDVVQHDVPAITRFMLREADALLRGVAPDGAPYVRWVRGKQMMERL